jgi:hypothetical protein
VIGLTRSLSPRGVERREEAGSEPGEDAADALVRQASEEASAGPEAAGDRRPLFGEPSPADRGQGAANVVVSFPAMTQVTVVTDGPAAPLELAAEPVGQAAASPIDDTIGAEAIEAIEADIATLLASLDHGEPTDEDDAGDEQFPESAAADDDGESVTTLLSELNRLWQADPEVAADRAF